MTQQTQTQRPKSKSMPRSNPNLSEKVKAMYRQGLLRAVIDKLEEHESVLTDARRLIASYEPGTLIGPALALAQELAAIDGEEEWAPWLVPGGVASMTDEELTLERVVAERDLAQREVGELSCALSITEGERDAARAELAEARAEVGKLKAGAANAAIAYEQQIKLLRAPPPEDAMEAATRIVGVYVDRVGAYEHDEAEFQQYESDLIDNIARAINAARAELAEARAEVEQLKDDPEMDATDAAHPAWWRGQDYCFQMMCAEANDILDGSEPKGTCNEPWQSLRMRLWKLRTPSPEDAVNAARQIVEGWENEQDVCGACGGPFPNVECGNLKNAEDCNQPIPCYPILVSLETAIARALTAAREAARQKYAAVVEAARKALDEMCNTPAPRTSYTDAVDALDAALAALDGGQR